MVVCLCTKPLLLKGHWIHDVYFSAYAREEGDDNKTYKWFFPLFARCPTDVGVSTDTVTLIFKNNEKRTFWYYKVGGTDETTAQGSSTPPEKSIPCFVARPCVLHKTLSSSEYLTHQKMRHAFKTAHINVYAKCPMSYTDCYNTYRKSRSMIVTD